MKRTAVEARFIIRLDSHVSLDLNLMTCGTVYTTRQTRHDGNEKMSNPGWWRQGGGIFPGRDFLVFLFHTSHNSLPDVSE
jgi:hypothetical protein